MGWTPDVMNKATFAEFIYSYRGWQRAQGIDPLAPTVKLREPMSIAEAEELFAKYS